ncbi:MAG: hypothetical protein ACK5H4_07140 [Lacrimispora sphenoides]
MAEIEAFNILNEKHKNRFIIYYTLKWIWKEKMKCSNNLRMNDLYFKIFPTKKGNGNRTLYNRLLKCSDSDLDLDLNIEDEIKRLSDITGLSADFFSGKREFPISGLPRADWEKYIRLRSKHPKSEDRKIMEKRINEALKEVAKDKNKHNNSKAVNDIISYIMDGHKRTTDAFIDRINQMTGLMSEFTRKELDNADPEIIEKYLAELKKHYDCIEGINVLNKNIK